MDFSFLRSIGLTPNEIKIYSALLSIGLASSGKITSESGLHRSRVYEGLARLVEKGLVSSVKKGKTTFFEAASSERIIDVLEDERMDVEKRIAEMKEVIPKLNRYREAKPTAEAYILQGPEGFKAMRRDALKYSAGEILLIGAIGKENRSMQVFYDKWTAERVRSGIKLRILYKNSIREKFNAADAASLIRQNRADDGRFLPSHIDNPAVINVFGDRVVNVLWKGDYPLCFVMVNRDIADAYRKYFEMLWNASGKDFSGKKSA